MTLLMTVLSAKEIAVQSMYSPLEELSSKILALSLDCASLSLLAIHLSHAASWQATRQVSLA